MLESLFMIHYKFISLSNMIRTDPDNAAICKCVQFASGLLHGVVTYLALCNGFVCHVYRK